MTNAHGRQWEWVMHSRVTHGIKCTLKCKEEKEAKRRVKQNKDIDQEKESGTSSVQQHKNTMCHCHGEKGHCMSDCPMKNKMLWENWAKKKGMQMIQNLNNEATSKANKPDDRSENDNTEQQPEQNNQKWKSALEQNAITRTSGVHTCTIAPKH